MKELLKAPLFTLFTLLFALSAQGTAPTCARQFSPQTAKFDTLKNGPLTVVIDAEEVLNGIDQAQLNQLYGANVVTVGGTVPASPKKIKGTVVHLGDAGFLRAYIVGENNPTKGFRDLYQKFDDKIVEYLWATRLDPNIMPISTVFVDYAKELNATPEGRALLANVESLRKNMLNDPNFKIQKSEKILLVSLVQNFISLIHRDFPAGAIIKLAKEFQSADASGILKSDKMDVTEIVNGFSESFLKLQKKVLSKNNRTHLSERDFADDESSAIFNKNWSFIKALVFGDFNSIMAQKQEAIIGEGRMSMAGGKVYNVVDRFYKPWGPPELFAHATKVLNEFIAKAQASGFPMDKMSGGVDFALLDSGRIVILDFNFGAMDGFLDGINSPITTNMFIANLTGQRTPLLEELSQARNLDFENKWRLILSMSQKYLSHLSAHDRRSVRGDMVRWLGMNKYVTEKEEELLFQKAHERFQK